MAIVAVGPRKGERYRIMGVDGKFAILENHKRMRFGMLEVEPAERRVILEHYVNSPLFDRHYDYAHFLKTNRFKRIIWTT